MTEPAAVAEPDNAPPLLKQSRLVGLTSEGPSLHQAASRLLQRELLERYPKLTIDPDKAVIATPLHDEQDTFHFEPLTHALIGQGLGKPPAAYVEGESFLTSTPRASHPVHLAIDMDELNALLNELAPFLFVAFQQRQLDFWNETSGTQPRWQALANSFKAAVDVESATGWDADECALGRLVAAGPDKQLRTVTDADFKNVRACLLDIDRVDGAQTYHQVTAGAVVMTATHKKRELIVMYTIASGYESFASMTQLGESLPERLGEEWREDLIWRLIEPEGSIFEAVVWALLASQLDAITTLDPAGKPAAGSGSGQQRSTLGAQERQRFAQLDQAIPAWLQNGSVSDLHHYSRYIDALGRLRDGAQRDVFNDDLPLIKPYAQEQMRKAIVADNQPGAALLPLDALRVTVTNSFESGGFTLPNPHDQSVETLAEFALQNSPPYQASLAFDDKREVPGWLTVDYLSAMAQQVNIGDSYPKLLKQTLMDDPVKAAHRKTRYTRELPLLLPLLALECKLRHRGDIDEHGYRYVCQLMEAITDKKPAAEHPVSIRPLAFIPRNRLSKKADTVANMFIIGPRNSDQGPCLLYRPALDAPLLQFASLQNLMYALYQQGELRDSVLAWLDTEALSFEYAQYVFSTGIPSPWTITQLAFEPLIHLDLAGPIDLANTPLTGDILATLYEANSRALTELAERQSVSNSERRWALLADSGWALFSVASNFFNGAAGAAVWVWQSIGDIQRALDAHEKGDKLVEWKSTGDVLLVLGILLAQHVAARRNHSRLPLFEKTKVPIEEAFTPTPPVKPSVRFDSKLLTGDIPVDHLSTLVPGTLISSEAGARFTALINSFEITAPDLTEYSISPVSHLYEIDGKTCAQVGARWFQVVAVEGEPAYIVDPVDPARTGLAVKYDEAAGKWHWDLKLRLRGGGPTGRIAALRREKQQRKDQASAALQRFLGEEKQLQSEATSALLALPTLPGEAQFTDKVTLYLDKAKALGNGYTEALEQLQIWHQAGGGGVFYQSQMMRMTVEQHRCLTSWLRVNMRAYAQTVQQLMPGEATEAPLSRSAQRDLATQGKALSDDMITVLQTLHRSMDALSHARGMPGKIARDLEPLLPRSGRLDLLANEIGMSSVLCLREQPKAENGAARASITTLTSIAANASHDLIPLTKETVSSENKAERINQLTRFNDLYTHVDQLILELPATYPEQFHQARLDHLRELVGEFHALTRDRLVAELPEVEEPSVPPPAQPDTSTAHSKVKISKTRPRQPSGQKEQPVREPDSVEEIPFIKLSPPPSAAPKPPVGDIDVIAAAMELNLKIDDFNKSTAADAMRPGRIPADIQDMFDQQAAKLAKAADDVDIAIAAERAKGEEPPPVGTLGRELRDGAARTRALGVAAYAGMLKKRKPREAYLQWLAKNDQVEIEKDPHGRIRTKGRKDYFQEYRILDKANENKALWVAHFHYDNLKTPDDQLTVAHLKFADAYLLTLDAKTRQTMETFDAVDNVLRRPVDPAARDLFLKPQAAEQPAPV
ncbi:MAG: hypothetical protein JWP42_4933 [Pseudomonas sp.]|nr:hypothetical protein [Pseudomonas sp.]